VFYSLDLEYFPTSSQFHISHWSTLTLYKKEALQQEESERERNLIDARLIRVFLFCCASWYLEKQARPSVFGGLGEILELALFFLIFKY
jgi:hypothetical protein